MKNGYFVFDGVDASVRKEISELHNKLIPYGTVAKLGLGFMRNTYYKILPNSGWLRCDMYSQEEKVVGFFSSARAEGSLRQALGWRRFLGLGLGLLAACARSPKRILVVMELLRRSPPMDKVGGVELLSFGVDEKLRRFTDPVTGLRISTLLFENCMNAWKARGIKTVFCRVKRDNLPVLLFYKNYGAQIQSHSDDTTSFEIVFDMDAWASPNNSAGDDKILRNK